jgi:hypothetical protein
MSGRAACWRACRSLANCLQWWHRWYIWTGTASSDEWALLAGGAARAPERACDSAGLPTERVIYPDAPGIDEWARCVLEGLQKLGKLPAVVAEGVRR